MIVTLPADGPSAAAPDEHEVLTLERAALARWCRGDPTGFLELCDPEVCYFDPFRELRIDGIEALRAYYDGLAGSISVVAWQVVTPRVDEFAEVALLTYRFWSWGGRGEMVAWNCSELYRLGAEGWRIVHSHWSFQAPEGSG